MDEYLEWERQMLIDYVEQSKSARCAARELLRARCSKSTRDKGCDKHERTLCYRSGTRHV